MEQFLTDALAMLRLQADEQMVDRFCTKMRQLDAEGGCVWVAGFARRITAEIKMRCMVNKTLLEAERDRCLAKAQAIVDGEG